MTERTVVQYTDGREFGGSERILLTLAAGLASRPGWRPVVAHHGAPGLAPMLAEARALGIETLELPPLGQPLVPVVRQLARELRALEPSVFHAHLPWPLACRRGLVAAALARVPVVVATAHLHVPVKSAWHRAKVRLVRVDRYLAVSEAVARGLREVGVDKRRITVVRNGTRITGTRPAGPAGVVAEVLPRGRHLIIAVGRLVEQKGHRVLLEALAGLPDVSLVVAGEGPLRSDLEALARRLSLAERVRFVGYRDDVPALLARADLLALASFNEGLPLSVLEAMAAGIPVVATRVGGTPEVVQNGETGLLVEPGDPGALRAAIRRLLDDPAVAARLGARGREVILERFSAETMVERVVAVYEELLAGDQGPGTAKRQHRDSDDAAGDNPRRGGTNGGRTINLRGVERGLDGGFAVLNSGSTEASRC